ncbi:MAG: LemA family protein [Planctomycetia bacterium]|nr:LemA family protein [Planctomycetia bacterium]
MADDIFSLILCALVILSLIMLGVYHAYSNYYKKIIIDSIPFSKTNGVFIGLVELKGVVKSPRPLVSYLTETECVYYSWEITENWERWETESYYDEEEKRWCTRKVLKTGVEVIASDTQIQNFQVHDEEGHILVNPAGAHLETVALFCESVTPEDPLYYEKGPAGSIPDSTYERTFSESALPCGQEIYIMGYSSVPEDGGGNPIIAYSPDAPMFLITHRKEESVSAGHITGLVLLFILGVLFSGVISAGLYTAFIYEQEVTFQKILLVASPVLSFFTLFYLGWAYVVHCGLVMIKNRVSQAFSNIDVQLKRRNDLIPQLVEVVRGFKVHEKHVQYLVAKLRGERQPRAGARKKAPIHEKFSERRGSQLLKVLVERYPVLKADEAFMALQKELQNTENKIMLARTYYNNIATNFNTRLQVFPESLVAKISNLKQVSLYNLDSR